MESKLKILFVEDLPTDVELAKRTLSKEGIKFESCVVDNEIDFIHHLEDFRPDVIISDYNMPKFDGMRALKITLESNPNTPFLLLTGSANEEIAVKCMKAGATDYIIKEHITRLPLAVKEALEKTKAYLEKEKITRELKESEEKFRSYAEESPNMIFINKAGHVVYINKKCIEVMGYTKDEFLDPTFNFLDLIVPEYVEMVKENFANRFKGITNKTNEYALLTKDKRRIEVSIAIQVINYEGGNALLGNIADITERKRAEEQLRESKAILVKAQEIGRMGSWEWDLATNETIWSEEVYKLYGLDPQKDKPSYEVVINTLSPECKHNFLMAIEDALNKRKPFEGEYSIIRYDGTRRYTYTKGEVFYNQKGNPIRMYGIVQDITERKAAELKIRENEEIFNQLMQHSPIHIFFKDENIRAIRLSNNFEQMLNMPLKDILGKNMDDLFPSDLAKSIVEDDKKIFHGDKLIKVDEELDNRYYTTIKFPINIEGKPRYLAGFTIDITERKLAENALRESEEKYRSLFENMLEGFAYCKMYFENGIPQDFIYLDINRKFEELTGLRNVIGKKVTEVIPGIKESNPELFDVYGRVSLTGKPEQLESYVPALDMWFSVSVYSNREEYFIAVFDVITNRKKAELALKDSEEKYRKLVELSPDAVLIHIDGIIQFVNIAAVKLFDAVNKDNLIGKKIIDLVHSDYKKIVKQRISKIVDEEINVPMIEEKLVSLKGKIFDAEVTAVPINVMGQNGVQVIARNIAERKHTEEALKESEERFRSLYENSTMGLYRTTPDGKILLSNPTLVKMLGYSTLEELESRNLEKDGFEPTYDRKLFLEQIEKNGEVKGLESAWVRKDGTIVYISESAKAIRDSKGKTLYYDGTVEDITKRKKAQESLIKSELRFKQVSESAHEWIWEVDKNGIYTYVSPIIKELLGYEAEEIIGIKYFYDFFDPEIKEELKKGALEAFARKESFRNFINCNIHKDGRKIILSTTGFPILDKGNNLIGYRGADVDITDRIRAEEALRESEERFRHSFDYAATGMCILGINKKFQRINQAFTEMIGYNEDEMKNFTFSDITHPDDLSIGLSQFKKMLDDEIDNASFEKRYIKKDGRIIWAYVSASLIRGTNLQPQFFITQIIDITDRKRAEEEILMLAHSLRSVNECVSITDLDDNIVFVNDSFLKTYGYNENELIGKNVSMLRSFNNSTEIVKEILPNTISGGWHGELWNKRKDRSEFPIYLSTTIINDKEGKPLGLIGVATDITERKRAEQELIEAKELAQQSDKLKSEFLAQMSHEIRTPLNAIVGNVDYLSESFGKKIDPDTRDSLDSINMASNRIIRTVDLILNVSELQTSGYKPQFRKVGLKLEVLSKLYQEYQLTAKQKGLEFIFTCKEKDANVYADEYSITQIFANLIDNAIKYTKKGKVEILLEKDKTGKILVEVKDTGIGISKEFLPKLFDPFVQEEQGYSRSFEGNGLGLALVKNYCHINNAIIEVESEKNVGSTFRVIFN